MRTRYVKSGRTTAARINLSNFQKRIAIIGCVLMAVITLIFVFNVTTSAHNTYTAHTVYTNLCIGEGDTLWDIAVDNYSPEYGSFDDYISEIRSLNHISNDIIHSGEYLVIPICI